RQRHGNGHQLLVLERNGAVLEGGLIERHKALEGVRRQLAELFQFRHVLHVVHCGLLLEMDERNYRVANSLRDSGDRHKSATALRATAPRPIGLQGLVPTDDRGNEGQKTKAAEIAPHSTSIDLPL